MTATATYTKLKSGDWGLRIIGAAGAGATVTARKRDGSEKTVTVGRVVWSGDGVTLATIGGQASHARFGGRYAGRGECAECGERITRAGQRCWETGSTCHAEG